MKTKKVQTQAKSADKGSGKKGVLRFVISLVLLLLVSSLFAPAMQKYLPAGTGAALQSFIGEHFSGSAFVSLSMAAVAAALLTLLATWLAGNVAKFIVDKIRYKKRRAQTLHQLVGKLFVYAIYVVGGIIALGCLGVDTTAIFVSVGIVGIVVGFGAQSLIEDLITGLFIILEGEFAVGDIIAVDGFRGEVKSIGLRTVSIIDPGGNIRIINNSEIGSVVNLSEVTSVAVVNVPISYEANLKEAEAAVREALAELPTEYPDIFTEVPVYKGVDKLTETHMELMVVARVAEENIYNARRIMHGEIRYSCEKIGLGTPSVG